MPTERSQLCIVPEEALFELAEGLAQAQGLTLEQELVARVIAAELDEGVMGTIERAAYRLGLSHKRMFSFSGHDTQAVGAITPSAMVLVPSVGAPGTTRASSGASRTS